MSKHIYSYLALGDSYTIGESVPLHECFPYQTVQILRAKGLLFHAPEIVARTGWTSFELAEHVLHTHLNEVYDFVTLLIGVNNQYRGLSRDEFASDFNFLLKKAIHLAGGKTERVIVLSIPDWGATPFAKEKDSKKISEEIDGFNHICEKAAGEMKVHYIAITEETRIVKADPALLAADGLHYSGTEHVIWAQKLAEVMVPLCHK